MILSHRGSKRFDRLTKGEVPMPKSKTALLLASILVGSVAPAPSLYADGGMMGMMQSGMMGMMGRGGMMQGGHGGMMQGSQEGMMNMMKQMSQMMRQMSQLMDQYSNMMSSTRPGDQEKKNMPSESD